MNLNKNTLLQYVPYFIAGILFGLVAHYPIALVVLYFLIIGTQGPRFSFYISSKIADALSMDNYGGAHYTIYMTIGIVQALIGLGLLGLIL